MPHGDRTMMLHQTNHIDAVCFIVTRSSMTIGQRVCGGAEFQIISSFAHTHTHTLTKTPEPTLMKQPNVQSKWKVFFR